MILKAKVNNSLGKDNNKKTKTNAFIVNNYKRQNKPIQQQGKKFPITEMGDDFASLLLQFERKTIHAKGKQMR